MKVSSRDVLRLLVNRLDHHEAEKHLVPGTLGKVLKESSAISSVRKS
jgi:hypothetical protein